MIIDLLLVTCNFLLTIHAIQIHFQNKQTETRLKYLEDWVPTAMKNKRMRAILHAQEENASQR